MTAACPVCRSENAATARFCQQCAAPLHALADSATRTVHGAAVAALAREVVSSGSIATGGFTPGTILADRYRIVGLLGRGGMGEVYRADDLKLAQPVALKFLPPDLASDPVRRERFFAEVAIARQISHPNVCRVYDIAEVDGRLFLSMEYVDGEDLASLITRIGHLPAGKAMEIARQLCAGLAAAHDKGVLHRDLKPANVMLDGRGRVRITDFGLAVAAEDAEAHGSAAGTPAYMAPEQLAGQSATIRTDIYSLGLVLYELHTGRRAFTATTLAELRRLKEESTPDAPSEITRDIDPAVERVIQRCIEKDPRLRPASALQVAAALPGGDPLAAALAAGETPSPEMVAASGATEGLAPRTAWIVLALTAVLAVLALAGAQRGLLFRQVSLEHAPWTMADRARQLLAAIGYTATPIDAEYGVRPSHEYLNRSSAPSPHAMFFWYRERPDYFYRVVLMPEAMHATVQPDDPWLQVPGETRLRYDAAGRLFEFIAVPPVAAGDGAAATAPDFSKLFEAARLGPSDWIDTQPEWNPLFHSDHRTAWKPARPPAGPDQPIRIEAASVAGRPTWFAVVYPWTPTPRDEVGPPRGQRIADLIMLGLLFVLLFAGAFFARRNVRMGRGDRRGAGRLVTALAILMTITWVLDEAHVPAVWEAYLFFMFLGWTLLSCAIVGVLYLALEPYVRRTAPSLLIGWSRLLAGGWRDPLVGRDVLIGCLGGAVLETIRLCATALPSWLGAGEGVPGVIRWLRPWNGAPEYVAYLAFWAALCIFWPLGLLFLLFVLRLLLRNLTAAGVALFVLMATPELIANASTPLIAAAFATGTALSIALLIRFGLLASICYTMAGALLREGPSMFPLSAWYSGLGLTSVLLFAAFAIYGFRTSLGGRPAFAALEK
ncbi:MAG TPA: serine/threonine-protein kinase [Vicinamibacterales bacterium]